jgi:SPP1 family predicted phage head-tail adaptor
MLWRDVVTLIAQAQGQDAVFGGITKTPTTKDVFADKQSVGRNEFYQAMQTGLRPEVVFVIMSVDYSGESQLTYNAKTYDIIRSYSKDDERVELVCKAAV